MITVRSLGGLETQRPSSPDKNIHGPTSTVTAASIVPPAFAFIDCQICNRVRYDQDVVMPHEGQGLPSVINKNEQGGKLSCSCVPYPFGDGVNRRAVTNRAINPSPTKNNVRRRYHGKGKRRSSKD